MVQIPGKITPEVAALWEQYYPTPPRQTFFDLLQRYIQPTSVVLEIGAGSGIGSQQHFKLRNKGALYVGVDLDERVLDNPHLDQAFVCRAEALPFDRNYFDVVFHSMVAEHLATPVAALRETCRVLKPEGTLLFETVSRFYYAMMAARLTPHWFHEAYISRLGSGRPSLDVFPTFYRLNDRRAIFRAARAAGLQADVEFYSTPPGYLRFSRASFLLGVLYERTVERWFPALRQGLIVTATKWRGATDMVRGGTSRSCPIAQDGGV